MSSGDKGISTSYLFFVRLLGVSHILDDDESFDDCFTNKLEQHVFGLTDPFLFDCLLQTQSKVKDTKDDEGDDESDDESDAGNNVIESIDAVAEQVKILMEETCEVSDQVKELISTVPSSM